MRWHEYRVRPCRPFTMKVMANVAEIVENVLHNSIIHVANSFTIYFTRGIAMVAIIKLQNAMKSFVIDLTEGILTCPRQLTVQDIVKSWTTTAKNTYKKQF